MFKTNLLKNYIQENVALVIFIILCTMFTHGMKVFYYSISIDSEIAHVTKNTTGWIAQGRFGTTILKYLLGANGNFVPYTSYFISMVCIVVAVILWTYLLSKLNGSNRQGLAIYVFAAIFITFPTNAEYFNFATYSAEVSMGILLAPLSILLTLEYIFYKRNFLEYLIGIMIMVFNISIYQSFLPLTIAAYVVVYLIWCNNVKGDQEIGSIIYLTNLVRIIATVVVATIIYFLVSSICKFIVPSDGYLEGSILWGNYDLAFIVKRIVGYYGDITFINSNFTDICGHIFLVAEIFFLVLALATLFTEKKVAKFFIALSLIILPFIPMMLPIIIGNSVPPRTQLTIPFIVAIAAFIAIKIVQNNEKKRLALLMVSILLIISLHQAQTINKLYYSDFTRYVHDSSMAENIACEVGRLGYGEIPNIPVIIIGKYIPPNNCTHLEFDTLGKSIFQWNVPYRNNYFMDVCGWSFKCASIEQMHSAIPKIKTMPIWPNEGSVQIYNELIIVKLSDEVPQDIL